MPGWVDNAIMTWDDVMVTDHGRAPLNMKYERIGTDKRMAIGTLRRQFIGLRRSWDVSWENLPSTNSVVAGFKTVDGGMAGEDIEAFYNATPGAFRLTLRRGSAIALTTPVVDDVDLPYENSDFYIVRVMLTDLTKDVVKRGIVDIWNMTLTLEEV